MNDQSIDDRIDVLSKRVKVLEKADEGGSWCSYMRSDMERLLDVAFPYRVVKEVDDA